MIGMSSDTQGLAPSCAQLAEHSGGISVSRKEVFDIVAQEKGENPWNSRKFVVSLPPNKNANEREQTISKD